MRAAIAIVLLIAAPVRAELEPAGRIQRAEARRSRGLALVGGTFALALAGVVGMVLAVRAPGCDDSLDDLGCVAGWLNGGSVAAALGFGAAAVALGSGIAQLRVGSQDEIAVGQRLPAAFFAEQAARRVRRGRNLAIAGAVTSAIAIALAATAGVEWRDARTYAATTALGAIHGAAGLGLLSAGVTMIVIGRHDE